MNALIELETPQPYDLRRTMAGIRLGAHDPTIRTEDHHVAIALQTPEGAVSLGVTELAHSLEVRTWGAGTDWVAPRLPGLLGLKDNASAFDPIPGAVRKLWHRFPGAHLPKLPRVFHRLVQVTLLQLVPWRDACRSWGRLVKDLGEASPGPHDVRLPPSSTTLAATSDDTLVALGIRPKQARTVRRLAKYATRLERDAEAGSDELAKRLELIPGIGPWTIAYVRASALGCPDAVLLGDYNLPNTVAYILAGEPRASDERMLELLEPYCGHRFRVIRLVWMNGVSAPRRGPRQERYER